MTPSHIDGVRDVFKVTSRIDRAVGLRRDCWTWQQIAEECGYADRGAAHHAVMGWLRANVGDQVNELRILENERLDADETVLRSIIEDPNLDVKSRLRAIDTRTRLSGRRSRLNGMDAPAQVAISAGVQQQLQGALQSLREAVYGHVVEEQPKASPRRADEPSTPPQPCP